jgi:hypothetical protein
MNLDIYNMKHVQLIDIRLCLNNLYILEPAVGAKGGGCIKNVAGANLFLEGSTSAAARGTGAPGMWNRS